MSLTDYAPSSPSWQRNLAAGFNWKETRGFVVPLGKVGLPAFWVRTDTDRIRASTLTWIWGRRSLERNPRIYSYVLACYNFFFFYFILLWSGETRSASHKTKTKQTQPSWVGLEGSLNREKWPQKWLKNPRMNNGRLQVPGRCGSKQLQTHFFLLCY